MEVRAVNAANFETEVIQATSPVIVEFWTEGCKPCESLGRAIRRFSGQLKIVTCNIDQSPEIGSHYGISGIPSLLFFKNGQVVDQAAGYMNDVSEAEVTAKVTAILNP